MATQHIDKRIGGEGGIETKGYLLMKMSRYFLVIKR